MGAHVCKFSRLGGTITSLVSDTSLSNLASLLTYHQGDRYSLTDPAYPNLTEKKGTGLSIVFNGDGEGRISFPQVLFTRLTLMQTASFQRTLQFRFSGQQPSHYRPSAKKI